MSCTIYSYGFCIIDKNGGLSTNIIHAAEFLLKHEEVFGKTDKEKYFLNEISKARAEDMKEGEDISAVSYDKDKLIDVFYELEADYVDTFSNVSKDSGFGAAIAAVMKRETGINFRYFGKEYDFGISYSVSYIPDFPWNIRNNESEAVLTEPKMRSICKKYIDELGLETKPGKQAIEIFSKTELAEMQRKDEEKGLKNKPVKKTRKVRKKA